MTLVRVVPAVALVLLLISCAPAYHRDTRIADEIIGQLDTASNIGTHNVTVESRAGVVVLTGEVATAQASQQVERTARGVRGVETVFNRLTLNPQLVSAGRSQSELTAAVQRAIGARAAELGYHRLLIGTEGNVVTLSGEAETERDLQLIVRIAESVSGVATVKNGVQITHPSDDLSLARRVADSLRALPEFSNENIRVRAQNGVVALSGDVRSTSDADRALSNTLMVPGVRDVKSELLVQGRGY